MGVGIERAVARGGGARRIWAGRRRLGADAAPAGSAAAAAPPGTNPWSTSRYITVEKLRCASSCAAAELMEASTLEERRGGAHRRGMVELEQEDGSAASSTSPPMQRASICGVWLEQEDGWQPPRRPRLCRGPQARESTASWRPHVTP
jgi:hypothetical protein